MASLANVIAQRSLQTILDPNLRSTNTNGIPHPTCGFSPWQAYYQALGSDMIRQTGIFSNSVIHFYGANQEHGYQVSKEQWEIVAKIRPVVPAAIRSFFRVDDYPNNASIPTARSANFAVLNAIADLSNVSFVSSPANIDNILNTNTRITLFNYEAIVKHPLMHTSTAQLATAEFFSGITDLDFTLGRKLTHVKDHKKLVVVSKTLRNLTRDCYKGVEPQRPSKLYDCGFEYGADVTQDICDLFRYLCARSYSVEKNDPNFYSAAHEIEQKPFLDSTLFHYMQRIASICKMGGEIFMPRKLWEDNRANFGGRKATAFLFSNGTVTHPTTKAQYENTPKSDDTSSALDIHSINMTILDFICDVERFSVYAKVAPLCHIGVLLSARRFISKYAGKLRGIMNRTMLPTASEKEILQRATIQNGETAKQASARQRLEAARQSALLALSNQYKQQMNQMIYQVFMIYLDFAITSDPLRPDIHMKAVFQATNNPTENAREYVPASHMSDNYVDFMKMLYKRALDDNFPSVEKSLWITSAHSIPRAAASVTLSPVQPSLEIPRQVRPATPPSALIPPAQPQNAASASAAACSPSMLIFDDYQPIVPIEDEPNDVAPDDNNAAATTVNQSLPPVNTILYPTQQPSFQYDIEYHQPNSTFPMLHYATDLTAPEAAVQQQQQPPPTILHNLQSYQPDSAQHVYFSPVVANATNVNVVDNNMMMMMPSAAPPPPPPPTTTTTEAATAYPQEPVLEYTETAPPFY